MGTRAKTRPKTTVGDKKGRPTGETKKYTESHTAVARAHLAEGRAPARIAKAYPTMGLTVSGIKIAQPRIRASAIAVVEKRDRGEPARAPEAMQNANNAPGK